MSSSLVYQQWPGTLPAYLQSGATINFSGGLSVSSKVSGYGAIRGRSISYSKHAPVIGTMILTAAQKTILDSFYDTTLGLGSLSFQGTLDNDGTKVYKFTSPPRYQPLGDGYEVDIEVAILSAASSA